MLFSEYIHLLVHAADPYLNTDAGTMSPDEHGEVFVLDDGSKVRALQTRVALCYFDIPVTASVRQCKLVWLSISFLDETSIRTRFPVFHADKSQYYRLTWILETTRDS